jgi:hypothetical protein
MMRFEHIEPGRRLQIVPARQALVVVCRSLELCDLHDDRAFLRSYGQLLHLAREINRRKATGRRAFSIVNGPAANSRDLRADELVQDDGRGLLDRFPHSYSSRIK